MQAIEDDDFEVRCAAGEGISTLASGLGHDIKEASPNIVSRLEPAAMARSESSDRDQEIAYGELRSTVGYALGIIGGEQACRVLAMMLSDAYPEARYNAATGLARNGDVRAVPRLCEMLTIDNQEAVKYEDSSESLRIWKQKLVIINGLRGVRELYTVNTSADVDASLQASVQALAQSDLLGANDAAKYLLDEVSQLLNERAASS